MPQAVEVLTELRARGIMHFLFTHRGASTAAVLARTGLAGLFCEILTAQSSFPRKPAPDALRYLVDQYVLNPAATWYVGDRTLDMDCAARAGIRGILFCPPGSPVCPTGTEERVIDALPALLKLPEFAFPTK